MNIGVVIFQLLMIISIIGIPLLIVAALLVISKRNKRLIRIEEKLDKLIEGKIKIHSSFFTKKEQ
ncbi:hypothetical protein FVO58_09640 [Metabacillus halosaccharovorans]|nr:hypothetical protein [Metabacillus halosaccharovorans]